MNRFHLPPALVVQGRPEYRNTGSGIMCSETWPSPVTRKLSLDHRSPLAPFPTWLKWPHLGAGSTVTLRNDFSPEEFEWRDESHHFSGASCFLCVEVSIAESYWPRALYLRVCTVSHSVLKEEAKFWLTRFFEESIVVSIILCIQWSPRSNARTSGSWNTHPAAVQPSVTKAAPAVAHLLFCCQLVQYVTGVETAVDWLGSLVKNI